MNRFKLFQCTGCKTVFLRTTGAPVCPECGVTHDGKHICGRVGNKYNEKAHIVLIIAFDKAEAEITDI